uniref:Uncharacterized protein n=1 Tax=Myotis myotis TaxID=51298 RepID=A0A7J7V421_MYOMY|nr:hypothetical protein mMyoMyo1_008518 [Myotis myotis]
MEPAGRSTRADPRRHYPAPSPCPSCVGGSSGALRRDPGGPPPPIPVFSRGSCLWWELSWTGWGPQGGAPGSGGSWRWRERFQDLEGEPPSVPSPSAGPPAQDVPRAAAAGGPAAASAWPLCAAAGRLLLRRAPARPSLFPALRSGPRPSRPWGPQQRSSAPRGCPGTSPRPLVSLLGRVPLPDPAAQGTPGGLWGAPAAQSPRSSGRRGASAPSRPAPCSPRATADSSLWLGVLSCVSPVLLPRGLGAPFPQAAASVLPETCSQVFLLGLCGRLALSPSGLVSRPPPPEGEGSSLPPRGLLPQALWPAASFILKSISSP